jgi:hypothetical protein
MPTTKTRSPFFRQNLISNPIRYDLEISTRLLNEFIARVEPFFEENGFYEKEIARRTEQFGNIAHVWSIYACRAVALRRRESRHNETDPEPALRTRFRKSI